MQYGSQQTCICNHGIAPGHTCHPDEGVCHREHRSVVSPGPQRPLKIKPTQRPQVNCGHAAGTATLCILDRQSRNVLHVAISTRLCCAVVGAASCSQRVSNHLHSAIVLRRYFSRQLCCTMQCMRERVRSATPFQGWVLPTHLGTFLQRRVQGQFRRTIHGSNHVLKEEQIAGVAAPSCCAAKQGDCTLCTSTPCDDLRVAASAARAHCLQLLAPE